MPRQYTYRIFPTEDQQKTLTMYYGCVRYVYNQALQYRLQDNNKRYKDITYDIQQQRISHKWLEDCPAQCLQLAIGDLCNDYISFKGGSNHPIFKKKQGEQSITFPQGVIIKFKNDTVKIPKLKDIKCVYDRQFIGKINTVTLYKTITGKYYIKVLVDNQKKDSVKVPVNAEKAIGISAGINTWYGLSNGTRISKPKRISDSERVVRIARRSLDRKVCGSKRRDKQKIRLLLAQEKLNNRKRDYLQKVSTKIVREYDTIVMERVPDKLKEMISYKCLWYSKNLIEIGKCEPCPDICSSCGTINRSEGITWVCRKCETVHNRNKNNAENIKNIGLRV